MPRSNSLLAALALCLSAGSLHAQETTAEPELGLMGTVPIYWGEAAGFNELLNGDAPSHWVRGLLEEDFTLAPLDYLSDEALAGHRYLLLAQPRGLSPEENVALDAWVRRGGQLLLFADPMMTGESRFHIGDRRRPQDVTLLSPLLSHWGLELAFDPQQAGGPQLFDHHGTAIPVNMRGTLRYADNQTLCNIPGDGLLAHCVIDQGQAMIVADAAMLDIAGPYDHSESALRWLIEHVFGNFGDNAGNPEPAADSTAAQDENTDNGDHTLHSHHADEREFGVNKNN